MTLVIMAAGMGSRFGSLKQVEPVGPNGEFIIDYSINDAIKSGFNKVVFIIKRENYDIFNETVGKRFEELIEVKYVFQDINNVPEFVNIPSNRIKPWGTAHAVLSAKGEVTSNFAVINADDYYGTESFVKASEFLKNTSGNNFGFIGYKLGNTVTENGTVSRGLCQVNGNVLSSIIETMKILKNGNEIRNVETNELLNPDMIVSMNFFLFTPVIFDFIEEKLNGFFKKYIDNLEKCEFYLPILVEELIKEDKCVVTSLSTSDKWYGVTYKEDKIDVVNYLKQITE